MATLEVHDDQGRVQFVELSRDHPVLFGTSAACDVILEGEGIRPVHGRIRWKSSRFKVEASPDAQYVLINGHKMTTGSLHQGDELTVGHCRIFLLKADGALEPGHSSEGQHSDGPTAVLSPAMKKGRREAADATGRARKSKRHRDKRKSESPLERDDWLDPLGIKDLPHTSAAEANGLPVSRPAAHGQSQGWLGRIVGRALSQFGFSQGPVAPGRERIVSSPLVLSLVAALGVLIGMGFWLKAIISATIATRVYNNGVQFLGDGDYRTAIRDLDAFVQDYPEDPRTGKARVLRALANVKQYVSPNGGTWSSALEAAREMMDSVGNEESFRDERVDLAELVIRIGEGLADRARQAADPKALVEAESAVTLHAQVAGEPAPAFLNRSRLPSRLKDARAAVLKARIRSEALAAMDRALATASAPRDPGHPSNVGSSRAELAKPARAQSEMLAAAVTESSRNDPATLVYQARDGLVDRYPDLSRDPALIQRMTAANELIRKEVTVTLDRRSSANVPRPDPLGPPTSVVLRSVRAGASKAAVPAPETTVFALADGFAYALDGATGSPLWHIPIGLAAPFVPRAVPGDGTVLAFDSRFNELLRLDSATGSLKWRLDLREPVRDPPLILGNQIIQAVPSGHVAVIALESGELAATIHIGRPLERAPVADDSGRLYVMGRRDCLFVLAREPLSCITVDYLGHLDGAIPCAPARLGPYLVIPENDGLDKGLWHILVIEADGKRIRHAPTVEISGWTWQTPASSGSIIWGTGDKGGYEAFAVGDETTKVPLRSVARLTADASTSGPAFALARSERELWVASGHSGKFSLDPERATIEVKTNLGQPGPALAPLQLAGNRVIMTFQDQETGGVAIWGVDASSGQIDWKTILATSWPTALHASADGGAVTTFGRDGRPLSFSTDQLARGGFVIQQLAAPGDFSLPAGTRISLDIGGKPGNVIVPPGHSRFIWVQEPSSSDGWRKLELPAALASDPVALGDAILVPGLDARAYLIDPVTGQSKAEPFVRKFDRDRQGTWFTPVLLDLDTVALADDMGSVNRVALKKTPVARLVGDAEVVLDQKIVAAPAATGGAVIVGTADGKVRALAARDLGALGSWQLNASLAGQIHEIPGGCFVMDRAGGVMFFGRDGQRVWSIKLGAEVVGSPIVQDQTVCLLTSDGNLHVLARSDGTEKDRRELTVLPTSGSIALGARIMIAAGRSTIRPLEPLGADSKAP